MKKLLSIILVLTMLLASSAALAENMGVQIIGGPKVEVEPVNLDDIKLDIDIPIEGYGTLKFYEYQVLDILKIFRKGEGWYTSESNSGVEAQYVLLKTDVLNTTVEAKKYGSICEVKVIYDEIYEFKGWHYQYNWNLENNPKSNPINPADNFAINPMYVGHYCFGCTLPNAVVDSTKPLKMIINIDGNEITYNIRK